MEGKSTIATLEKMQKYIRILCPLIFLIKSSLDYHNFPNTLHWSDILCMRCDAIQEEKQGIVKFLGGFGP